MFTHLARKLIGLHAIPAAWFPLYLMPLRIDKQVTVLGADGTVAAHRFFDLLLRGRGCDGAVEELEPNLGAVAATAVPDLGDGCL